MSCERALSLFLLGFLVAIGQARATLWLKRTLSPWNPLCYALMECCFHQASYKPDVNRLEQEFDDHLFGQHLARLTILGAIDGHVNSRVKPEKPLVLSLHGPAGTGKNHISRLLVNSLFKRGLESSFVTIRMSTKDYPHYSYLQKYKEELVHLITSKVASCPHHVFIFDEIENMPPTLLDSIKVFLDHHKSVDGIDYRSAIFIFRSNLAGNEIVKHVWQLYEKGGRREDIGLPELEKLITNTVFHSADAGLYKAKIIDSHLVSHFVPFLPLEATHVRQCVQKEFLAHGVGSSKEMEDDVLAQLQFNGPRGAAVFALKGCKNVAEKVNVVLYKYKRKIPRQEL